MPPCMLFRWTLSQCVSAANMGESRDGRNSTSEYKDQLGFCDILLFVIGEGFALCLSMVEGDGAFLAS